MTSELKADGQSLQPAKTIVGEQTQAGGEK